MASSATQHGAAVRDDKPVITESTDADVDLVDFIVLQTCYTGPGGGDQWRRGGRMGVMGLGWVR